MTGVPDLSCASAVSDSPCGRVSATGWALAIAAALLNGSFAAFAKTQRVQAARVPVHVFFAWACVGITAVSLPAAWLVGFRCVGAASVASGALFALSTFCIFGAVQLLGLSQAAGVWCGVAALVSFAADALARGPGPAAPHPLRAAGAAACLLLGLLGVAHSARLQGLEEARVSGGRARVSSVGSSRWRRWGPRPRPAAEDSILEEEEGEDGPDAEAAAAAAPGGGGANGELGAPLLGGSAAAAAAAPAAAAAARAAAFRRRHGLGVAAVGGAVCGLSLLPMGLAAPYECRGLPWVPGMALGVAVAAAPLTWLMHLFTTRKASPRPSLRLEPAAAAAPGAASGAVWGAANACTILAIQSLGLEVAYPTVQAGLFVAGLWGVLLFSELTFLLPQLVFWLSGAALVAGAGLLTAADC